LLLKEHNLGDDFLFLRFISTQEQLDVLPLPKGIKAFLKESFEDKHLSNLEALALESADAEEDEEDW